jgi:hypothetical protein
MAQTSQNISSEHPRKLPTIIGLLEQSEARIEYYQHITALDDEFESKIDNHH